MYYQAAGAHGWKKAVKEEDISSEAMAGKDGDKKSPSKQSPLKEDNSQNGRAKMNGQMSKNRGHDYWHKNGKDKTNQNQPQAYYQRNDRFQARPNVHAPPKLTPAQRRARGPLPDWDEIQEYEPDFDYMNLMDAQYAQYYTMSMPPFDPAVGGMDPSVANMMIQQAQQHMAAFGFRPPLPVMQPPQVMGAAPPAPAAPTVVTTEQSRPASVASSSTPAALVSPGSFNLVKSLLFHGQKG